MELRIYSALKKYANIAPTRFHMPGHKGNKAFCDFFRDANLDVTELPFIDNESVVSLAEKDVAEIFGAKKSWFLTGGSTSGINAMVGFVKGKGNRLIIGRGSHKSVYSALALCGIEPIIVDDENYSESFYRDIFESVTEDTVGALLTYPDYYGRCFDLKRVSEILKNKGKMLLIDGAHGGHFKFTPGTIYAGEYADVWVDGLHKTFPTLNQGAVLHSASDWAITEIEDSLSPFLTTSPSYLLLASIEYGVKYYAENKEDILSVLTKISDLKKHLFFLGMKASEAEDPFKIYVPFAEYGIDPAMSARTLEEHGIFFEMCDKKGILFMFSPFNSDKDFKKTKHVLSEIGNFPRTYKMSDKMVPKPIRKLPYLYAVNGKKELVDLHSSLNRVSAINAGNFPPCKPLVVAGELIDQNVIDGIDDKFCFGICRGKIAVVKEDNER